MFFIFEEFFIPFNSDFTISSSFSKEMTHYKEKVKDLSQTVCNLESTIEELSLKLSKSEQDWSIQLLEDQEMTSNLETEKKTIDEKLMECQKELHTNSVHSLD
jgi:predicted  nucleic acid-binding Zn-ribbon protein